MVEGLKLRGGTGQKHAETDRQVDGLTEMKADSQRGREEDMQPERQADRPAARH